MYIETIVSRYMNNWPYIYFEGFRRLLRNGSLVNSFVVFVAVGVCFVVFAFKEKLTLRLQK